MTTLNRVNGRLKQIEQRRPPAKLIVTTIGDRVEIRWGKRLVKNIAKRLWEAI
jgi:hypothetical protein